MQSLQPHYTQLGYLRRMLRFTEQFQNVSIVLPLTQQLSWSHFLILIPLKTFEAKIFYANLATEGALGKRELRKQIASKTFDTT